jgi:MioC protein
MVAETLRAELASSGVFTSVLPEDFAEPEVLAGCKWLLVCCATHGEGDVPDHLLPLANALESGAIDLGGLRYGVIALGDRTYSETYCGGAHRLDALLRARGARRIGDVLTIDASTQPFPDQVALKWLPTWLRKFNCTD